MIAKISQVFWIKERPGNGTMNSEITMHIKVLRLAVYRGGLDPRL
jgi:hypothetical protein